ncbi:MAG: riboflavin biosynthesis protein RibF [Clostridia bacterium]|nr:riboflavin biosynthesis protein RibF [Clostridia bacterium]
MQSTVAALGTFDGVHIGHHAVLESALGHDGLRPICLSFQSTPKNALGIQTPLLLTDAQRTEKIKQTGFAEVVLFDFAAVRHQLPAEFLDFIVKTYQIRALCCGFNYRFGADGRGDIDFLRRYCAQNDLRLTVTDAVTVNGVPVSSTEIRTRISGGEIEQANTMLGYNFFIAGIIVHGFKRGRTIGFPTINQDIEPTLCCPKHGVYVSSVLVDGKRYKGLTNIGNNPTFALPAAKAETYIHGFSGDIYGKHAKVELLHFVRPEIRFTSADQLKAQIQSDLKTIL